MKIHHKRLVMILVNGILGYFVINFLVSCTEVVRGGASSRAQEQKKVRQEDFAELDIAADQTRTNPVEHEDHYDETWFAEMESRQVKRKQRLRRVCQSLYDRPLRDTRYLASNKHKLRSLIVNDRFRFVYSIVYKVGSTNWERVIVQDVEGHQGVPNQSLYKHKALQWMPKFNEDKVKEYLERYTKFIFVRNPLSRILSGYRDKFVDHQNSVFSSLARRIVKQYRTEGEAAAAGASSNNVTFPEFIAYLVDSAENRGNPHWKPIHAQNMPCEIDFDIVGKLEDASDDIPFVLKRTGVWNVTDYGKGPARENTDAELLREYYSQIPPRLLQELYKIYEPDFHLFGYEMPVYF